MSITRRFAVRFIEEYQRGVSPTLGARCLFEPSCSEYGRQAFERHPTLHAARLTIARIRRCRPDHAGPFVDPVPR